jgi:hypothetical protein
MLSYPGNKPGIQKKTKRPPVGSLRGLVVVAGAATAPKLGRRGFTEMNLVSGLPVSHGTLWRAGQHPTFTTIQHYHSHSLNGCCNALYAGPAPVATRAMAVYSFSLY